MGIIVCNQSVKETEVDHFNNSKVSEIHQFLKFRHGKQMQKNSKNFVVYEMRGGTLKKENIDNKDSKFLGNVKLSDRVLKEIV